MTVTIHRGDCREVLRTLPEESVHCVVTSPPYWGLRDYGVDGQLGLERTLGEHVDTMTEVFREVRRVLRSDGTLWLNYGDSYATSINGRSAADTKAAGNDDRTFRDKPFSTIGPIYDPTPDGAGGSYEDERPGWVADRGRIRAGGTLKPKDLCGIPWRVAFALQADGWWLRQDIIWSKPNPMPESIRDRCTKAHEYIFLLSKQERYYYDADAIAENRTQEEDANGFRGGSYVGGQPGPRTVAGNKRIKVPGGWDRGEGAHGTIHRDGRTSAEYQEAEIRDGRNKRSVWSVATAPFPDAHFATFPPALIEPCILAGCPEKACAKCGAPWQRETSVTHTHHSSYEGRYKKGFDGSKGGSARGFKDVSYKNVETVGFSPSCRCDASTTAGTVLDPFGGAGTTGLVADRLGRNAILIELNPEYAAMAQRRIAGDAPMFADVRLL